MKKAAMKFAQNSDMIKGNTGPVKKRPARAASRGFEEHKTTIRSTAKNIYKPCFNLPPKEPKATVKPAEKSTKTNATAAAKAYGEAQRKKR